jgi:dTDP-4-dehydrorhamnose reductase
MKIIVTGAKGQLGQSIREESGKFPEFELVYTDIEELDICNPTAITNLFAIEKPNFVVNCAAYTAVDKAENDRDTALKINRDAPENLAKECKKRDAKLIHISTDYVFDGEKPRPYIEEDQVNPQSTYGITKLEGEQAVQLSGANAIIIRTSWLYSAYGNNFVKTMIRLGNEKESLNIVADQVGTPTYANDLAFTILTIAKMISEKPESFVPGIYHYSNEGVASWYDFTKAIFESMPQIKCEVFPIDTKKYPTPAKRPSYSVLDKSKIKTIFGISIPYWQDSLKKCITKLTDNENN